MRCIWLVITFLLSTNLIACEKRHLKRIGEGDLLPGCSLPNESLQVKAGSLAVEYFEENVGTKIVYAKHDVASLCSDYLIVPIMAKAQGAAVEQVWFVKIKENDLKRMELIRPE